MNCSMFFDLVKAVLGFFKSFRFVSCPDAFSQIICINAAFRIVQNIFDPVLILGIQGTANRKILRTDQNDTQHKNKQQDSP